MLMTVLSAVDITSTFLEAVLVHYNKAVDVNSSFAMMSSMSQFCSSLVNSIVYSILLMQVSRLFKMILHCWMILLTVVWMILLLFSFSIVLMLDHEVICFSLFASAIRLHG